MDAEQWGVDWALPTESQPCQDFLWSVGSVAVLDLGSASLLGVSCSTLRQYEDAALLNSQHPLASWLLDAIGLRGASDEALVRLAKLVAPAIKYGYDNLTLLLRALDDWRSSGLDPVPPEMPAPEKERIFGRRMVLGTRLTTTTPASVATEPPRKKLPRNNESVAKRKGPSSDAQPESES
jgi:hypothetical protein